MAGRARPTSPSAPARGSWPWTCRARGAHGVVGQSLATPTLSVLRPRLAFDVAGQSEAKKMSGDYPRLEHNADQNPPTVKFSSACAHGVRGSLDTRKRDCLMVREKRNRKTPRYAADKQGKYCGAHGRVRSALSVPPSNTRFAADLVIT